MSKPIFIEVKAFYQPAGSERMDESCAQCLEEAQDKAEALGLSVERLQQSCEDLCSDDIEESTEGLMEETMLIKLDEIRSISKTQKGRALIQSEGSVLPRLFASTYDEVVEKIKEHITIL